MVGVGLEQKWSPAKAKSQLEKRIMIRVGYGARRVIATDTAQPASYNLQMLPDGGKFLAGEAQAAAKSVCSKRAMTHG